jgi:hypothetical protein
MRAWSARRAGSQCSPTDDGLRKESSPVSAPVSDSTRTAWTTPDGNPLGVLSYLCTPPSGLAPFTLRQPPAVIMARTCNQFRANAGGLPPSLR